MFEKLKSYLADDQIYFSALVVLVGLASFALGRLSLAESGLFEALQTKEQSAAVILSQPGGSSTPIYFVASKNGSKYHLPWCPGASQMKAENKIRFKTVEDALGAGYEPAANCPGI